MQMAGIVFTRL